MLLLPFALAAALTGDPADTPRRPALTPSATRSAADILASKDRRVRAVTPAIRQALIAGARRSPTLAALVADVQASDVIVYIEPTFALPPGIDGRLYFGSADGGQRYLRVQVRSTLQGHHLVAVIAHELQHVREVAGEAAVVDGDTLADFYRQHRDGTHSAGRFDTESARRAQRQVRAELLG